MVNIRWTVNSEGPISRDESAAAFGRRSPAAGDRSAGFTLIELMIVMAIVAILATIAVPSYTANIKHAREAILREDLATMRGGIEQYTMDKQKAPQSGDELVQSGYLREIPVDPMTHRREWNFEEGSMLTSIDETQGGLDNVHSMSQEVSTDGTTYNSW